MHAEEAAATVRYHNLRAVSNKAQTIATNETTRHTKLKAETVTDLESITAQLTAQNLEQQQQAQHSTAGNVGGQVDGPNGSPPPQTLHGNGTGKCDYAICATGYVYDFGTD